mmetsp:Transcript_17982/g.38754  ORF Transcript_17982/g.38754 Transcript_17982/m.38754 type:complete len:246 (+) Transcript_17982:1071-1808(+)
MLLLERSSYLVRQCSGLDAGLQQRRGRRATRCCPTILQRTCPTDCERGCGTASSLEVVRVFSLRLSRLPPVRHHRSGASGRAAPRPLQGAEPPFSRCCGGGSPGVDRLAALVRTSRTYDVLQPSLGQLRGVDVALCKPHRLVAFSCCLLQGIAEVRGRECRLLEGTGDVLHSCTPLGLPCESSPLVRSWPSPADGREGETCCQKMLRGDVGTVADCGSSEPTKKGSEDFPGQPRSRGHPASRRSI